MKVLRACLMLVCIPWLHACTTTSRVSAYGLSTVHGMSKQVPSVCMGDQHLIKDVQLGLALSNWAPFSSVVNWRETYVSGLASMLYQPMLTETLVSGLFCSGSLMAAYSHMESRPQPAYQGAASLQGWVQNHNSWLLGANCTVGLANKLGIFVISPFARGSVSYEGGEYLAFRTTYDGTLVENMSLRPFTYAAGLGFDIHVGFVRNFGLGLTLDNTYMFSAMHSTSSDPAVANNIGYSYFTITAASFYLDIKNLRLIYESPLLQPVLRHSVKASVRF